MSPQVRKENWGGGVVIVRKSHLDTAVSSRTRKKKNKKRLLLTSVNTELACQVKTYSKCIVRERELSKTMQHDKPWLQTDIDDEALQSVIIV